MIKPQSEAELSEIVTAANGPIRISGGGTRPIGRPVDGTPLSVSELSGIVDYEPGALTLVAQAGTPISQIEAALAAEGQRLPFEPMDHRTLLGTDGSPTIGGAVAANVSGPRRVSVGAARDFLLGVRFVDGTGRILKNGGRVMKNVTGYDLVKLMAGSYGTLGILTEVSFKVLPTPEKVLTLEVTGLDQVATQIVMTRALTSPYEVSGAAVLPGETPRVLLRLEGFSGSVAYRVKQLTDLLRHSGDIREIEDNHENISIWRRVRDVEALSDCAVVWRVSAIAKDMKAAIAGALQSELGCRIQYDWGGALAWVGLNNQEAEAAGGAEKLHTRIQSIIGDRKRVPGGGHATLIKADAELKAAVSVFQPEPAAVAALSRGVRAQFDPKGILNPGLMD